MGAIADAMEIIKEAEEVKELVDLIIPEIYPYAERLTDGFY